MADQGRNQDASPYLSEENETGTGSFETGTNTNLVNGTGAVGTSAGTNITGTGFNTTSPIYDDTGLEGTTAANGGDFDGERSFREETAGELAVPLPASRREEVNQETEDQTQGGTGIGYAALAASILSLFFLPVLLGAVGIVLGFVARRRGAGAIGSWAIGLGAVTIIVGIFVLPFF